MSVPCVFVYADGKVGLRVLERHFDVFKVPVVEPLSWKWCDDPTKPMFRADSYTWRGKMFDGRPVMCADGFDVKEAYVDVIVSDVLGANVVDDENMSTVRNFIRSKHADVIELDEWCGAATLELWEMEDLKRQHLTKRCARLLIAVRQ
jgi:hypothetical protein